MKSPLGAQNKRKENKIRRNVKSPKRKPIIGKKKEEKSSKKNAKEKDRKHHYVAHKAQTQGTRKKDANDQNEN